MERELVEHAKQNMGLEGEYYLEVRHRNGCQKPYELHGTHRYSLQQQSQAGHAWQIS
jgi:hypothetical protein